MIIRLKKMQRRYRPLKNKVVYSVASLINLDAALFDIKKARLLMLKVLKRAKFRFAALDKPFKLINFNISKQLFCLCLKPKNKENLSDIMQWILSVFAINWNKKAKQRGHVFMARFFSEIVKDEETLREIFYLIDMLPVDMGVDKIDRPEQWEYGGLWQHQRGMYDIVDRPDEFVQKYFPEHMVRV